jgi:hypothetical protein
MFSSFLHPFFPRKKPLKMTTNKSYCLHLSLGRESRNHEPKP